MKTFHVKVAVRTLEIYEVVAENSDDASENWSDGDLIDTDDEALATEVLSTEEV